MNAIPLLLWIHSNGNEMCVYMSMLKMVDIKV